MFKTTDGGESWEKVPYVSPHTGVVDMAMDLWSPDWLYAAAFQRERRVWSLLGGGPESGIYRSTDGGESWKRLTNVSLVNTNPDGILPSKEQGTRVRRVRAVSGISSPTGSDV